MIAVVETKEKMVPELRFKDFEGNWEKFTLFDLSNNVSYGMNAAATQFDGIHKYLRITDIDEKTGDFKPKPLTSPDGVINKKFQLKKNDIVFARTGASVGKPYLYNEKDGNLYYAGFLIKFSISGANAFFIYCITQKEAYNKWVYIYSMRSGQPGLNAEEYKALKLTIPSLSEQEKIAAFLTAVDEKLQQLSRKKELLEQYKKGVMQKLFAQELRFKDDDGKDFPDWENVVMEEVFERVKQKNNENNQNVLTISAQQGLVNQIDYFNHSVSAKDLTGYYLIEKGDFAYNKSYSKGYPMGAIKRLDSYEKGVVSTLYICFRIRSNNDSTFYKEFLDSGGINHEIHKIAQEGARNHGLLNMSVIEFFRDIKIPRPSIEEQVKIGAFLNRISTKIDLANTELIQTQAFKKGLLQKMFV